MDIWKIILIVIVISLLYFIIKYIFTDTNTITSTITSATTMQTIDSTSLTNINSTGSTNFSYSIWLYINDWNYKYGDYKVVLCRTNNSLTNNANISALKLLSASPLIYLDQYTNNLNIMITCYGIDKSNNTFTDVCVVPNIPIQSWANVLISIYDKTLDVYLDGKLVKTYLLKGIPKVNANANLYITPYGGFDGWVAKCQYYANSTDPQSAWNIYKNGYSLFGGSLLSSLSQYKLTLNLSNNGTQVSSYNL
jgi:hypothetical protein